MSGKHDVEAEPERQPIHKYVKIHHVCLFVGHFNYWFTGGSCEWAKLNITLMNAHVSAKTKGSESWTLLIVQHVPMNTDQFAGTNRKTSSISHTKSQHLNVSCILLQLSSLNPLKPGHEVLTHWGRDKMDAISQTTSSSGFSWMKMFEFRLKFQWSLFLSVQLTIFQHWFR